jgi:capsular exopolysaccharide synthesis family protein
LSTLTPLAKPSAAAVEDLRIAGVEEVPATSEIDIAKIPQITWTPSLAQLPALEDRGSAVEQFRSLRSRMQEFRDLNTLKSILVSSGLPQEGKSFITANLAISFARHKAGRVLLIDGDMRRATLHKLLGCPQGPGLTEYLSGTASITEVMQRPKPDEPGHPLPHGLASLTFIPAGTEHDKAADLSGNRRFEVLLAAAAPHFDWIVVDSSPVNLVSDGVNLARACDAVLLVARGGVTKYEIAQRAVTELKASKVLGFVLNAVKNPPVAGGYYGYDGYDKIEE